jgi:hypothetical protein
LTAEDHFERHAKLIDQIYGTPKDITVGRISTGLFEELKAEFSSDVSFLGGARHLKYETHPVLEISNCPEDELKELNKNLIPGVHASL